MAADTGTLIEAAVGKLKETKAGDLLRLMLAGSPEEDIASKPPEAVAAIGARCFDLLKQRKPGKSKIAAGAEAGLIHVAIINDDMPFIVDSTLALLNELGFEIELFLHPVIAVRRAADGTLEDVQPKTADPDRHSRESFIYAEAAPPQDAAPEKLQELLTATMADIRSAVLDWRPMQQRVREGMNALRSNPPPIPAEDLVESMEFLQWLLDNHFTFLGLREYAFAGKGARGDLSPVPASGLGILRDGSREALERGGKPSPVTPEVREFLMQPAALIITKSDMRSNVHRRTALDYVGIKLFSDDGELTGELRILGLFTSTAYTQNPNDIPVIRRKLKAVVKASGHDPSSHNGKALAAVLESYPRDELFQIDTAALAAIASGILKLEERPRAKLFVRRDRFDRFVSAFVFFPRDRFNSAARAKVGELIASAYGGHVARFAPLFGDGTLVRVHYIVQRGPNGGPDADAEALEAEIVEAIRNWDDRLEAAGGGAWRDGFPEDYKAGVGIATALKDIAELEKLSGDGVAVEFIGAGGGCHLRLYHNGPSIPLSNRLPILENMGFRSIAETTYHLAPKGGEAVIHDILLEPAIAGADVAAIRAGLEHTFMTVWRGEAENDGFNALTLAQSMDAADLSILRAGAKYLRQAGLPYSPDYVAQTLVKHGALARKLVELFHARLDPAKADAAREEEAAADIEAGLAEVQSLDEDKIFRRYLNLFGNILRTNFWQRNADGSQRAALAFKIASRKIEGLPHPRPFAEIFVHSPDVEGIHLRGGAIARGGLRWSDRPEDFRTEVLGLQKAQSVKNAVIIPVGAKGGFVPKKLPPGPRDAVQAEGVRAYKIFITSLLQLTDNIKAGKIVPPADTARRDGDDPYLVVAADKGTATFSDIANGVSADHGFWLDDAFASGGSAGYDHKKMAITARGAWEAVKRHFREMDIDIQSTPFDVIGIGDMSGDVFGNGMLLSRKIRLVAAFDHRDIFIDPDPDMEASFAERQRLFGLARSSWQDYDRALISKGGGVFPRSAKSIPLTPEMKAVSGLAAEACAPLELLAALLRAPCDLLWFGGIGTYVKAAQESHADAGDRANDPIRADATELRAKVIGEGANLGVTQKGRVAFALAGGRIDNDAVDNSAGVNSSDIEVNLKIALGAAEAQGALTREARNTLLASMTEEVAGLVLRNNYLQTLCLSAAAAQGSEENGYALGLMQALEKRGMLDRKLESLPTDDAVLERDRQGQGIARPELAVLMAYAKLALHDDILKSAVPDDPYLSRELARYFPKAMQRKYAKEIESHRLRREIISTMLANSMINRGGPSLVSRLRDETGAPIEAIVPAYAVARDSYGFGELNGLIDGLDARIPGAAQNALYAELQRQLRWATLWFLRHERFDGGIETLVATYRSGIAELALVLPSLLPEKGAAALDAHMAELAAAGLEAGPARRIAQQRPLLRAPDIVKIAAETKAPLASVARALFASSDALGVDALLEKTSALAARDLVERQAINRLVGQVFHTHRAIVSGIAKANGGGDPWAEWTARHGGETERTGAAISALAMDKDFGLARLAVAQGALADLAIRA
jgi:glutamate dehydrogenase